MAKAKIISFGNQKGGVGKTTTAAITAFLLAKESRVLAVDFDSQGNLTGQLTQRSIYDFEDVTVYEACADTNPERYLHRIHERLHLLPAEDKLAFFYLLAANDHELLRRTLEPVSDQYDYIIMDLPPHLGPQTVNGLHASDFIVPVLLTEPHSLVAMTRFLDFIDGQRSEFACKAKTAGILAYSADPHSNIDRYIMEQLNTDYADQLMVPPIARRVRVKEYSATGILDATKADRDILEPYAQFVKELKARVG